jgi:hydrogenase nickel incorporation protein HypA/HybF
MHEYSIVQALVERIEAEAAARGAIAVDRVFVRIGELSGVEVELLRTAYDTFRERTICDRAPLEIDRVRAEWCCSRCGTEIPRGRPLTCGACGGSARLRQGDEILLDRIEMEVR